MDMSRDEMIAHLTLFGWEPVTNMENAELCAWHLESATLFTGRRVVKKLYITESTWLSAPPAMKPVPSAWTVFSDEYLAGIVTRTLENDNDSHP